MTESQPIDRADRSDPYDDSVRLSHLADIWREHVRLDEGEGGRRDLLAPLIDAVVDRGGDDGDAADRNPLERVAGEGEVGAAWDVLGELHLALDRAVDDGDIPSRQARRLRKRLARVHGRLHRAGLRTRLAARRDLLRDITHDLRVPLNSVVFLTESLLDEQHGELSESQKRKLGGVYSASTTLLNFVNDLLDLSRSTEEDFECSSVPFSIRGVLDDAGHLVRPVADYHGSDLHIDLRTGDSWTGDPRLVRRVLLNLVTNGLEAAGEGGEVRVTVEEADGDSETGRIVVSDTGPGIDLERAEELLEAGDPATWKKLLDGTDGLGLLITGRLVRAAGGSVSVDRREEGGTRFTVDLPFAGSE